MLLYTFSILFRKDEEERESLIINVLFMQLFAERRRNDCL